MYEGTDDRVPVLIGAAQLRQRTASPNEALEPAALMAEAIRQAAVDAGLGTVPAASSIRITELYTCRYPDPGRAVARLLGTEVSESAITVAGGNGPQLLVNDTARDIRAGRIELAFLAGAECWRTRRRARAAGLDLPWGERSRPLQVDRVIGDPHVLLQESEAQRGIGAAPLTYALFESAIRAAAGRSLDDHRRHLGALWSEFSAVAAGNPHAWDRTLHSADDIATVTPDNRVIFEPYTKLLNSNNDVDLGAALIMCSTGTARRLGVAPDRWVFPLVAVDCHDTYSLTERPALGRSDAIGAGFRELCRLGGIGPDEVDLVDLYSCFPSSVQMAADAMGLGLDARPLTVTGGLSFAGGPWNNYAMHAIASMVEHLRHQPAARAMVWANGGYVTKHSFGLYASTPFHDFRSGSPQAELDVIARRPDDGRPASGEGVIEAYTVGRDRHGQVLSVHASVLRGDGRRCWGQSHEGAFGELISVEEGVGRAASVDGDGVLRLI